MKKALFFMKKALFFLAACFSIVVAKAESVKYMTFQTTDGTEHSLSLSGGIDISFDNGELVAKAADGEFRYHDGQAQQQQEAQVDEHKGCAAILACDERKAPDVA